MPEKLHNEPDILAVSETRDFKAYHSFLRSCRDYMTGALIESMKEGYQGAVGEEESPLEADDALPILDELLEFQVYSWANRHLQRFKYQWPDLGIFAAVDSQRQRLTSELNEATSNAGEYLRLNADIQLPDYYRMVDFHQHAGGVWSDELDGLAYELGRITTNAVDVDPDTLYRLSYSQFPDGVFDRVLDWGTGHGAGLIEWQKLHPESECHGVDLSAPCLKLAHKRACENGYKMYFSQQDVEHLDYDDDTFDLVFHLFMFHEIPPVNLKGALREVLRVLKPGGIFIGPEIVLPTKDPFMSAVWQSHAWSNNEPYSSAWFKFDMQKAAEDVGFSTATIEPFMPMSDSESSSKASADRWRFYVLKK